MRFLLPQKSLLTRVWLGVSLGLLLMMWLPALIAFAVDFTWTAHLLALIPLAGLTAGCFFLRDPSPVKKWDAREKQLAGQMLMVVLPLTLLSAYLQYTHCLRVGSDGGWWVGQSTYGDLPMHMSFITSLKNAAFPPDYALFPGQRLSYPFLTDSLSTSLYLMGFSLEWAIVVPGTLMMALCFMGVMVLAREMTAGKKTIILATLLFFLNGGLGFLYNFDLAGGTVSNPFSTVIERIREILDGYYATPTNQPTPYNLRWSNVIADLMVPQRTLLGRVVHGAPCFYLLFTSFAPEKRPAFAQRIRQTGLLAVWAGALPLIHTHSFLALGLCSLGMMVYDLIHDKERWTQLQWYLAYGVIAVVLSAPQLICFTFEQVFQGTGSGNSFLQIWLNWVNGYESNGEFAFRDLYFWFYLKNIGLPFLMLILALFERNPKHRRLFAGALPIILAVELVRFQPNIYDNNKLMYLAWLLCCMIVADWCRDVWHRLKGMRGCGALAFVTAIAVFLSAGLTLWRECVSNYQAFSASAVEAGEFARDNTPEHSTYMTGTQHLNPIASHRRAEHRLPGRICGCTTTGWTRANARGTLRTSTPTRRKTSTCWRSTTWTTSTSAAMNGAAMRWTSIRSTACSRAYSATGKRRFTPCIHHRKRRTWAMERLLRFAVEHDRVIRLMFMRDGRLFQVNAHHCELRRQGSVVRDDPFAADAGHQP